MSDGKQRILKFSEDYVKLPADWEGSNAVLIGVWETTMEILLQMPDFLNYDCQIANSDEFYQLSRDPDNWMLVLSFIHMETGMPFTTIRNSKPDKKKYYSESIGEIFELQYTGGSGA